MHINADASQGLYTDMFPGDRFWELQSLILHFSKLQSEWS